MKWMKHKKSRVMEMMRSMDTNGSGYINNINFIRGVCESGFETNEREMYQVKIDICDESKFSVYQQFGTITIFGQFKLITYQVVKLFDKNDEGRVDYYEFISALHPREQYVPTNDAEKIEDEVIREVARCRCCDRFAVHQIYDNKYRVSSSDLI